MKYKYLILAFCLSLLPISASAATVYLESSQSDITVGDRVIVTAKINTEGVAINTVEGDVILKSGGNNVAIQEFSLANSAFGLWPRTPSLSKDGQVVSFVGGVPGGFNIESATLFKIILEAKEEGRVTIVPQNMIVYANDGKGTKLPVLIKNLALSVGPKKVGTASDNQWQAVVAGDTISPENFIIVLGQDESLFEGKKFAFFSALDNQSGISYYEVSENGAPAVRSGSTYVLQDQTAEVKLNVTAFDKAGNKKIAMYPAKTGLSLSNINWLSVIVSLLVIVILRLIYKKWRKNKKNVSSEL
jgi:hypothetical protein